MDLEAQEQPKGYESLPPSASPLLALYLLLVLALGHDLWPGFPPTIIAHALRKVSRGLTW